VKWIALPQNVYWIYILIPSEICFVLYYLPLILSIILNSLRKFVKQNKFNKFNFNENTKELDVIRPRGNSTVQSNKPASTTIITELDDESTLGSISGGGTSFQKSNLNPISTFFILINLIILFICVSITILIIPAKLDNLIKFNWYVVFGPLWVIFIILILSPSSLIIFEILIDKEEDKTNILLGLLPAGIFLPGFISLILIVISLDQLIPAFPITVGFVGLAFMESMLGCIFALISLASYLGNLRKYTKKSTLEIE
jgi:hypothetical protein